MAIKATSIKELLALCKGEPEDGMQPASLALEAEVKRRLRKVGGKAADFVPYLLDAVSKRIGGGDALPAKGITLSKALTSAARLLGGGASDAVEEALRSYVAENDVSYRLKSA